MSAADADHVLIHDASDNTLKKALVSTIGGGGSSAADDITAGDAAVTISTSSGNITIDNGSSDDDIIFKGTDGGSDITALTLDMSAGGDAIFGGKIQANGALKLNSNTGTPEFQFFGSGTETGVINLASSNFKIESKVSDKDIIFAGVDGGSDITALTLDMSEAGTASFNHDIQMVDNGMLRMGAGGDLILLSDGTNGTISTNNGALTLDSAGNIDLDADSGSITFKDDGLLTATLSRNVGNFEIMVNQSDGDFVVKGNDGGSTITPFRLDMSTGGRALFAADLLALETAGQYLQVAGSSSNFWAIGSTGGNNSPGTASTTLAFHHYDGSAWDEELSLDASGNLTADGNITAYSDERLKDNIQTLKSGLDKVNQLRGVTYTRDERKYRCRSSRSRKDFTTNSINSRR